MGKSLKAVFEQALVKSAEPISLASVFGLRTNQAGNWTRFFGGRSTAGKMVNEQTTLQLSTAWACVRLISETIATLPIALYERHPGGVPTIASEHPLHFLLSQQPNADQTPVEFMECKAAALMLHGNSYVIPSRRSDKSLSSLEFVPPDRSHPPRRLANGSIEYRFTDLDGKQLTYTDNQIMHTRGFGTDGLMGMSAITLGANVFGSAIAADETAGRIFANGMNVGGVISTEQFLKKEQRTELREDFENRFSGTINAGRTMMLEGGMKYQQVTMTPEDAQMLQTRAFSVEEICRWFRVPPFMVGSTEKSTSWGTGIEQQMIGFLTFTLLPWMKRIEQSINRRLLLPEERRRFYVKFNVEGLLRADSAARAAFYSSMTQNGIYTRDDCREKEELPRMGGNAGVLTVQSNLLPIDKLGEAAGSAKARDALRDFMKDDYSTED